MVVEHVDVGQGAAAGELRHGRALQILRGVQPARSCACPWGRAGRGSPGSAAGPVCVSPTSELVGEIIASGPPRFASGISSSAQPELYGPTTPTTRRFANLRLRVRRALAVVEDAGLGGGVVARLVADAEAPGAEAVLAQDVCDRCAHLSGGQPARRAGEGRRRSGGAGPVAAREDAAADRGGQGSAIRAALRAPPAASCPARRPPRSRPSDRATASLPGVFPTASTARHAVRARVDARHGAAQAVRDPDAPAP